MIHTILNSALTGFSIGLGLFAAHDICHSIALWFKIHITKSVKIVDNEDFSGFDTNKKTETFGECEIEPGLTVNDYLCELMNDNHMLAIDSKFNNLTHMAFSYHIESI